MRRLALPSLALLSLAALSGCRDHEAEALVRAELRYTNLLQAGTRPEDPRFDGVLADLALVPTGSPRSEQARALERAITSSRKRVRTPLALGSKPGRPEVLSAQLEACSRLAQLAGAADGGVDQRAMAALESCRRKAEQLELEFAHGHESGHGDASGHGDEAQPGIKPQHGE